MTADEWEVARCLWRPKGNRNGKSQAIENGIRTVSKFIGLPLIGEEPNVCESDSVPDLSDVKKSFMSEH